MGDLQMVCERRIYDRLCAEYGRELVEEVLDGVDLPPMDILYSDSDSGYAELYPSQGTLPSRIEALLQIISWTGSFGETLVEKIAENILDGQQAAQQVRPWQQRRYRSKRERRLIG